MPALDDLSPDHRAVVSLLLKQGKHYDELAALLRTDAESVRQRAAAALQALGGPVDVPEDRREGLVDWLLGQQGPIQAQATHDYVEESEPAREWARAVAEELRPVGGDRVPEVPERSAFDDGPTLALVDDDEEADAEADAAAETDAEAEVTPLPGFAPTPVAALGEPPRSSRLGGALLIGGVVVVIAVVLVILLSGGSDKGAATATTAATTANTSTTSTTETQPTIEGQVNLRAPGGGKALGVANIIAQGSERALAIQGQGLRRNSASNAYAVWLAGGPKDAVRRLGFAPAVGANGRLEGVAALPSNWADYRTLEISLETQSDPKRPSDVVLRGGLG